MFVKAIVSVSRRCTRSVNSCRDGKGRVKKCPVPTLGRRDQRTVKPDRLIDGLLEVPGHEPPAFKPSAAGLAASSTLGPGRALKHAWPLSALWKALDFPGLRPPMGLPMQGSTVSQ